MSGWRDELLESAAQRARERRRAVGELADYPGLRRRLEQQAGLDAHGLGDALAAIEKERHPPAGWRERLFPPKFLEWLAGAFGRRDRYLAAVYQALLEERALRAELEVRLEMLEEQVVRAEFRRRRDDP